MLLDIYTRPIEKEIRYNNFVKQGKSYEADMLLEDVLGEYLKLLKFSLRSENMKTALMAEEKITKLTDDNIYLEEVGILYHDYEKFEKSSQVLEKLYERDMSNITVINYLLNFGNRTTSWPIVIMLICSRIALKLNCNNKVQ